MSQDIDLSNEAGYHKAIRDGHTVPFYTYVTLPNTGCTLRYVDNEMGDNVTLFSPSGKHLGGMTYVNSDGMFWTNDQTLEWMCCPECKSEFDKEDTDGWEFCPSCGIDVGDDDWEVMA